MNDRLTKEEVLHVAHLARIEVYDDEVEKYSVDLKKLMDDIDKIRDVECSTEDILVTPVSHVSHLRDDCDTRTLEFSEIQKNLPKAVGKFVEVWVKKDA